VTFFVLLGLTALGLAVIAVMYNQFRSTWGVWGGTFGDWVNPDGGGGVVYLVVVGALAIATLVVGVVLAALRPRSGGVPRARPYPEGAYPPGPGAAARGVAETDEFARPTVAPWLGVWGRQVAHAVQEGAAASRRAWTRLVAKYGPRTLIVSAVVAVVVVAGLAVGIPLLKDAVVVTPAEAFAQRYDEATAIVAAKVEKFNAATDADQKKLQSAGQHTVDTFAQALASGDLDGLKEVAAPDLAARLAAFEATGAAEAWRGLPGTVTAPGLAALQPGPITAPVVHAAVGSMDVDPDDVTRQLVTLTSHDLDALHLTVDGVPVDTWEPVRESVDVVPILDAGLREIAVLTLHDGGWVVTVPGDDYADHEDLFVTLHDSGDSRGSVTVTVGAAHLSDLYEAGDHEGGGHEILAGTYDVTLPDGQVEEGVDLTSWAPAVGISDGAVAEITTDLHRLVDVTVTINNGGYSWDGDDSGISVGGGTFPRVWSNNTSTNHKLIDFSPVVSATQYADGYRTVTVTFTGASGPVLEYMVDSTVNGPNTRYVMDTVTATAVLDNNGDLVELTGVTWSDPVKQ
jgi:hypothetical protein